MHRNTFLDSPKVLESTLRIHKTKIFCAGQLTGAEGYTEALSTGLFAASSLHAAISGKEDFRWPEASCIGALVSHLTSPNPDFQPMNFNFGLFSINPEWPKKQRKTFQIEACQKSWDSFKAFP